jgi:hypothetical protein
MSWRDLAASRFLSLDADLDVTEALVLLRAVRPELVVVRSDDAGEYLVLAADALDPTTVPDGGAATIGDLARLHGTPALVVDTGDGWIGGPPSPGRRAAMTATTPTVVLDDDGIVFAVVPGVRVTRGREEDAAAAPTADPGWQHLHLETARSVSRPGLRAVLPGSGGAESAGAGGPVAGPEPGVGPGARPMALEVTLPDTVSLGDSVPLLVELEPGPGGAGSAPLSVHADEVLEILASPTSGFTLTSRRSSQQMTVVVDGQTLPVKFTLRADVAGKGVVKVFAFRDEVCVASVTVSAQITSQDVPVAEAVPVRLPVPGPVTGAAVADLRLIVLQESYRGGVALRYRLTSADGRVVSDFGPHSLDADPSGYVHARFAEIQRLAAGPGTWGAAERTRLDRIGADLYEALVPAGLRDVLWSSERVRTLLVETEEPWIPWELCRMTAERDGRTLARGYLCELYEMSRWLPGAPPKPALRATRIGVIAPRDSGLTSAPAEVAMLEGLAAHGPVVDRLKATYVSVISNLESHRYDVLHFVGHGHNVVPADATRSEFALSGRWRLTPSDISGETRNLGLASPVVFMNACQAGQASMALHGIGGWAAALTRAGAGAFVGTHWDVRDDLALEFSTAFYQRLRTGTVAAAVREAREVVRAKSDGDPTWLAYTLHASPDAGCEFAAPGP